MFSILNRQCIAKSRATGYVAAAIVFIAIVGCAGRREAVLDLRAPVPTASVRQSVFLIGDAGNPAPGGEPVLTALSGELNRSEVSATVIFLGDNVYEKGMPNEDAEDRQEMERRLQDQIDAVLFTGATAIFIPGNHDWARGKSDGWNAVLRQEAYIETVGSERVRFLPEGGCPGPRFVDIGENVRIVTMDTQWWLHKNDKPAGTHDCPSTEESVLDSLRSVLLSAGDRHIIVAAHHTPVFCGPHGGYFTWKDHIFPLTKVKSWAWLPLPVIGSVYPLLRMWGISDQDLSGGLNEHMREAIESVFEEKPPLVYAGGHEHALEVFKGEFVRYVLVSGSGIYGNTEPIGDRDNLLWSATESGFMRLDFFDDGTVRLGVLVVDETGDGTEVFSYFLN
ncbi:MAG: metallophosphoesterase [bacterium]|nr:metallophosphoesterase [bacterium]